MKHVCIENIVCAKGITAPTCRDCRDCSMSSYGRNCYNDQIPIESDGSFDFLFKRKVVDEMILKSTMYRMGYRFTGIECGACQVEASDRAEREVNDCIL